MKKDTIQRFIKKYYLNGLIESAVWVKEPGILKVTAMTSDKKLFAAATWKDIDGLDDAKFGILTTKRLLALLKTIPLDDVSMDIEKRATGDVATVGFSAEKYKVQYVTSNLANIDPIPSMKHIPEFTVAIKMDEAFIDWFKSVYTAMGDSGALFTVVMSKHTRKLEVVVGYKSVGYSDRLHFQPCTLQGMDKVKAPVSFTAKHLTEVLKANPEFKDPILNVCEAGLASISFSEVDLDSQYYLVKVEVED